METKHTKGEWFYFKNNDRLKVASKLNYTETTLAEVFAAEEDDNCTDEANAKLIAAAPDLLEALINICKKVEFCSLDGKSTFRDEYQSAINAINKATK